MAPAGGEDNFIIIDIGSALIKAAQVAKTESGVSVSALATESVIEQKQLSEADAAAMIKLMTASAGMSSSRAVFVLSGNQALIKHMDFPKMPPEALEKNIKNEMKKELGASAENLIYHHITLKEFDAKNDDGTTQKKMKVLICAVDPAVTARIKAIAAAAGLTLHSIISSGLSFYSLAVKMGVLENLSPDEVLMFLDFGNSQITTNFISKDGLRFSKDINMGGSTLTTVIKTLNQGGSPITMSEAEELKFKIGIMPQDAIDGMDDTAPNANLHKVLNVSFRKLLQRIRLSTGYFFAHFKESVSFQALKTIYLLGGNSEIKGLKEFFTEYYGAAIMKINCWEWVDNTGCEAALCEKYNSSFANIAAAAQELFYPKYSIDFKQEKKDAPASKKGGRISADDFINRFAPSLNALIKYGTLNTLCAIAAFYLFSFAAVFGYNYWQISSFESENKTLEADIKNFESQSFKEKLNIQNKEYDDYIKKSGAIGIIEFKKYSLDLILLAVAECMPPDVSLKTVRFSGEGRPVITMSGTTAVYGSALKFNDALKKKSATAAVVVQKIDQLDNRVEFQLELDLSAEEKK